MLSTPPFSVPSAVVGQPYACANDDPGKERAQAVFTKGFFSFLYYFPAPTPDDKALFSCAPLYYGTVILGTGLPFVACEFAGTGWAFESGLNLLDMTEAEAARWLRTKSGIVLELILLEATTNTVIAVRTIRPHPAFVSRLRRSLAQQRPSFSTSSTVLAAQTTALLHRRSCPGRLLDETTAYRSAVTQDEAACVEHLLIH